MENLDVIVAELRATMKGFDERLRNLENMHTEIKNLTIGVTQLTERQSATEKAIEDVAKNVEELKDKPAKRWDTAIGVVVSVIITAFVTYIITSFLGK